MPFLCYFWIAVAVPEANDFAVFAHLKDRVFTDFDEIRQEIEAETDRLGGKKVRSAPRSSISILVSRSRTSPKNQSP